MMWKFFKEEEKRPFTYPSIEERRNSTNYLNWIIVIVLIIIVGVLVFSIF